MAKTPTTVAATVDADRAAYLAARQEIVNRLRGVKSDTSLTERITNFAGDKLADAGDVMARLGGAVTAGVDSATAAYNYERERQATRTADKLLRYADKLARM